MYGQLKIAEMLVYKSDHIDLNAKDNKSGQTGFHFSCAWGKASIVDMLITNAEAFNIDLTSKDKNGKTGFQIAQDRNRNDVANLIKTRIPYIAE